MSGGYTGGPSVPRSWIVSHVKSSTLQKPAVEPTRVRLGSPWILDGSNPEEKSWEVHGCEIEAGPRRLSSSRCKKGKPHGKTRPPKQKRTTTSTPEPSGCGTRTNQVTCAGSSQMSSSVKVDRGSTRKFQRRQKFVFLTRLNQMSTTSNHLS